MSYRSSAGLILTKSGPQFPGGTTPAPPPPSNRPSPETSEKKGPLSIPLSTMVATCPECFTPITEASWIVYNKAKYHKACFTCHDCKRRIGSSESMKTDLGKRTCVDCAKKDDPSIGEKKICHGCEKEIEKSWVIGLGEKWHSECFKCTECERIIDPKEKFYKVNVNSKDVPKCTDCKVTKGMADMEIKDTKCGGCGKDTDSSWVVALERRWHHGCFKCSHCDRLIDSKESFSTNLGKPVCMGCQNDHFRKKCDVCKLPIAGTSLIYKDDAYHHCCINCYICDKPFEEGDHEKIRIVNGKDFKHVDCKK